jgi:hypothetical protein
MAIPATFPATPVLRGKPERTTMVTVSVNEQLRPDVQAHVFSLLRRAETLAVCAALAI